MANGLHALIVEARFYTDLADHLLAGATAELERAGATFEVITVPGALEIPPALSMALASASGRGRPFDLSVVLGCVIRGETGHYEVVAGEANRAVMDLAIAHRLCLGNGILTVENREQALERARADGRDKGGGAVRAALALARVRARFSA